MTPHVRWLVGLFVGWSVTISLEGRKLHFHALFGALVIICTVQQGTMLRKSIYTGKVTEYQKGLRAEVVYKIRMYLT